MTLTTCPLTPHIGNRKEQVEIEYNITLNKLIFIDSSISAVLKTMLRNTCIYMSQLMLLSITKIFLQDCCVLSEINFFRPDPLYGSKYAMADPEFSDTGKYII
jgi:hypothetical protein